jgi:hypothetical protein
VIPSYAGSTPPGLAGSAPATIAGDAITGNIEPEARLLGKQGVDVASAQDLNLGSGNYFVVTGTTTIHGIVPTGWTAGSLVILQFSASVIVTHSGAPDAGDAIFLAGAANLSATPGDTLTVVRDAAIGVWREIARSVI